MSHALCLFDPDTTGTPARTVTSEGTAQELAKEWGQSVDHVRASLPKLQAEGLAVHGNRVVCSVSGALAREWLVLE